MRVSGSLQPATIQQLPTAGTIAWSYALIVNPYLVGKKKGKSADQAEAEGAEGGKVTVELTFKRFIYDQGKVMRQ